MFKKLISLPKTALAHNFSTYYRFQDSIFNFAASISGKSLLTPDTLPGAINTIHENYQKGIDKLIIRLKENNDEVDVINIAERIKELQEKLPDLENKLVQGFRYPMRFNQRTKLFLHNEFIFGLKTSQMMENRLFPHSFFFVESNDFFQSMIHPENKEEFEKALFNLDVLEEAIESLEFATLVYTLKYEDGQMNPDNLKKFFETYTSKNVAFDLELNRAFLKEPKESKKKNTSDLIKFVYGFEPRVKALTLSDYIFTEYFSPFIFNNSISEEVVVPDTTSLGDGDASAPIENKPDEKVKAIKKVDIGEGVIDYKLVFDLIKISKFRGILVFPEGTSLNAMEKMIEKTKEFEFKEQTETQVTQYLIHKANIAMRTRDQPGIETML